MSSKVKDFLEDEILDEISNLRELELGSEEHARALDGICKASKVYFDSEKAEKEAEDRENRRKDEKELKLEGFKEGLKNTLLTLAAGGIAFMIDMRYDNKWRNKIMYFEENGTIRSMTGRQTMKFSPRKFSRKI